MSYPKGTAIPQRADFNTLDNPFHWTIDPDLDRLVDAPAAGLHFVVFNPTSDDFAEFGLAMDGVLPMGHGSPSRCARSVWGSIRSSTTTHRQNFLVPPRKHRSFPLSELT